MRAIYLNDKAVEALRRGEFIPVDLGDFWCKLERYDIDEQIKDAFGGIDIVFEPDFTLKEKEDE